MQGGYGSAISEFRLRGCRTCAKPEATFICAACQVACYCSKECQKFHWKAFHRRYCDLIGALNKTGAYSVEPLVIEATLFYVIAHIDKEEKALRFANVLEDGFYAPPQNEHFELQYRDWKNQFYVIVSIPGGDAKCAHSVAASLGYKLLKGMPGNDFPCTPRDQDNVFTLMTIREHRNKNLQ